MIVFSNILCVLPDGVEGRATLERAVSLAENNQAELTVMDVVPAVKVGLEEAADLQAVMASERLRALETLVAPWRERLPIQSVVLVGTAFLEIIRAVLRNGHDVVIKPAENPRFVARLFGSNDMHLLRKCPCPVWLTRPDESSNYRSILAAIDFEPDAPDLEAPGLNHRILSYSTSLALSDFASLHVVHVWDAPGEMTVRTWSDNPNASLNYVEGERSRHQRGLDGLGYALREQLGAEAYDHVAPQFHLFRGNAAMVIPEKAREMQTDLVVMGTLARTGIPGLFIGNTAEAILEQLQCSVLAIKPAGFVSPVTLVE